jgi:hypothetical protein
VTAHFEIEPLTSVSRHYYAVDNPFTLALDTTPLLLPNFLAKQLIRSRFIESAQSELSRNAGRLRADYQERLELSARTFLQKFHQRVSETLVEIENALKRALDQQTASAAERAAAEKRLTAQQQLVDAINALNQLS